jgi:hypothetical protein
MTIMTEESPAPVTPTPAPARKKESPLSNILINIVIPALILSKLSSEQRLGPLGALLAALSFPLGYFLFSLVQTRKTNFISVLGFVSILLSGSFGLLQLSGTWFAVKEAAIPALIGVATVVSLKTKYPLVKTLLFNDQVIDVPLVESHLDEKGQRPAFERLLVLTTWLLAASFLLSAVLNFILAIVLLKSPSGTPAFNEELGKMTALSYPVIVIPSMAVTMVALWRLLTGIRKLTGLTLEQVFKQQN